MWRGPYKPVFPAAPGSTMQRPELHLDDLLQLRQPHPCGNDVFKVVRLGADIGLECTNCGRRVLLERRKLANRFKKVVLPEELDG